MTVAGVAEPRALANLGVDSAGILAGAVGVQASLQQRRDGRGDVAVHLDLAHAAITQARLGLNKPAGAAAAGDLKLVLDHDRLVGIEHVAVTGDGISVQGGADIEGGRPSVLRLQQVRIGADTDLHGEIALPQKPGDAYRVNLQGSSIDASGEFGQSRPKGEAKAAGEDRASPPYRVDVRFDRVRVGNGQRFTAVSAHVEHDGHIIRRAQLQGRTAGGAPFSASIEPGGGSRRLEATAGDVGALLRGLDVAQDVTSGRMSLSGTFDDRRPGHPLTGRLDVEAFRIRGAAAFGKILQGMTLYGLADAMSGPGLNFTRLVTQFHYAADTLELTETRAFSSSLGLTAKGELDLARRVMAIEGTVVPAYFFNSLLGGIPLVGRIFSPERGGGLIAVNYSLRGPFDDPSVGVNPLSALTPGFLRGLFGVFDGPKR